MARAHELVGHESVSVGSRKSPYDSEVSRVLLLGLVALAHAPLVGADSRAVLALQLAVLGVAALARQSAVVHPALLAALVTTIAVAKPLRTTIGTLPIVPLLVPLLASTFVTGAISWAHSPKHLLQRGRIDVLSGALTLATAIVSAGALLLWASWTDNLGVGASMMQGATRVPIVPLVLLGIPLFAILNAATEEAVYRGVLQRALATTIPNVAVVVALQALAFAALHYQAGFPNGVIGYAMVTIYGSALGYLRHRTGGLAAPFLAHVLADLVIGYVLLAQVI